MLLQLGPPNPQRQTLLSDRFHVKYELRKFKPEEFVDVFTCFCDDSFISHQNLFIMACFMSRFVIIVSQKSCSRQGTTSTCQARPTLSILILYHSIWVSFESKSFGEAILSNFIFKNNTFFRFNISITVN